jgi:transcription elongation factor SPT5
LDQNGEIRTIQPHQITNKRDSKRAIATDANGNSIQAGDTVVEKDGERRSGTILHLYRQLVYLHSREYVQNFGVWVTRTRNVASIAAKGGRAVSIPKKKEHFCVGPATLLYIHILMIEFQVNTAIDTTKQQPYGNGNMRGGFNDRGGRGGGRGGERGGRGGRGGFFGHGRGGRDNLISQTVRIAKGPHKGYLGIVKDTTDSMARVELHTNTKTITVEKSKLVILDAHGGTIGPAAEPDTFASPSPSPYNPPPSTPKRFGDGGMTPMHYSSGSRTPAWNSGARTPNPYSMDGNKTPAWNAGARTPNPYAMEAPRTPAGAKTPAWDSGSKTPRRSGGATDGGEDDHWNAGARTPAADSRVWGKGGEDWPTPSAWRSNNDRNKVSTPGPNTAPTPYEAAPTPGAHMIPMTPAALTAPTPAAHMISAPTPGNYLPTTPAAGQMPQTPFMPTGGDYNQADDCKLLVKKPFLYAMCLNIDLPLFISSYSSIYW